MSDLYQNQSAWYKSVGTTSVPSTDTLFVGGSVAVRTVERLAIKCTEVHRFAEFR